MCFILHCCSKLLRAAYHKWNIISHNVTVSTYCCIIVTTPWRTLYCNCKIGLALIISLDTEMLFFLGISSQIFHFPPSSWRTSVFHTPTYKKGGLGPTSEMWELDGWLLRPAVGSMTMYNRANFHGNWLHLGRVDLALFQGLSLPTYDWWAAVMGSRSVAFLCSVPYTAHNFWFLLSMLDIWLEDVSSSNYSFADFKPRQGDGIFSHSLSGNKNRFKELLSWYN